MAISISNPGIPSSNPKDAPKMPDTKKLKKVEQDVEKIKQNIQKNVSEIDKTMENFAEKSAKLVCLLRLDMIADKLDKVNPRLASQVDEIANAFEKEVR